MNQVPILVTGRKPFTSLPWTSRLWSGDVEGVPDLTLFRKSARTAQESAQQHRWRYGLRAHPGYYQHRRIDAAREAEQTARSDEPERFQTTLALVEAMMRHACTLNLDARRGRNRAWVGGRY